MELKYAKLKEWINELETMPIYSMSLGSRELFHSNFWSWLMKNECKIFVQCFFKKMPIESIENIDREKQHKDITITTKNGKIYVIENKFKAYYNKEQLEKYSEGIDEGAIAGIAEIEQQKLPSKWHFISYEKIANNLEGRVLGRVKDKFLHNIIQQYCKMIRLIYKIITFCENETKNHYCINEEFKEELERVRLYDLFQKQKAIDFVNTIIDPIKNSFNDANFKIETKVGYNNCKPTIDIVFFTRKSA